MSKFREKMKMCLMGTVMGLALALAVICLTGQVETWAEENGELDYKVVHTYDEMMDYLRGDDSFYSYTGKDYTGEQGEKITVDESWTVEVKEAGWLIIYDYNNYGLNNNSYAKADYAPFTYLYSNKLRTKPVNREDGGCLPLSAERYDYRYKEMYYVQEGTYYLDYSGEKWYWDNCTLCAVFLPAKDIIDVKEIKYNADYSEATVFFTVSPDIYDSVGYTDQKITSAEALKDNSQWKNWMEWDNKYYYTGENGDTYESGAYGINTRKFLENGWTIKANGEYSVCCHISYGVFAGFDGIVNFTIDKIGANIKVKSLKLKKSKASLKVGATLKLDVTVSPKDATDKTITWKSSNSKVAKVDENGNVTAVKKGTCTITATSSNGKKAKCKITVKK